MKRNAKEVRLYIHPISIPIMGMFLSLYAIAKPVLIGFFFAILFHVIIALISSKEVDKEKSLLKKNII